MLRAKLSEIKEAFVFVKVVWAERRRLRKIYNRKDTKILLNAFAKKEFFKNSGMVMTGTPRGDGTYKIERHFK